MADRSDDGGDADRGTYLVTAPDPEAPVVEDVESGQVHTLSAPDATLERGDVLTATLAPEPPAGITRRLVAVHDRHRVTVRVSDEAPTRHARDLAAGRAAGDLVREPRAGTGEIHVLPVGDGDAGAAAREVADDEATLARAARMDGVERVEVRHGEGVVSVRYLP